MERTGNVWLQVGGGQPSGKGGVRAPRARPEAFRSAFEEQGGLSGLKDPAARPPLQGRGSPRGCRRSLPQA